MCLASLQNLQRHVTDEKDKAQAIGMVQAAMIFHNLLKTMYFDVMTPKEVQEAQEAVAEMTRTPRDTVPPMEIPMEDKYIRRELLTSQMLEYKEEEVDLAAYTW